MTAFRIGIHPSNLSLFVLSHYPDLLTVDLAGRVEWVHYRDGQQTIPQLATGAIDLGGTGSTPPITAQADGIPVVYVATSQPRPSHGAIVVKADSPIQSIADLHSKTVVLSEGSFLQHFLAVALDRVGLTYGDVQTLNRGVTEAAQAFLNGEAEVWVAGDPYLAEAQKTHGVRILSYTADVISDRSVFFTRQDVVTEQLATVRSVVRSLERADRWIATHFAEVARFLAAHTGQGVDAVNWEISLRRRPWGLLPIADEFVDEQQQAADLFYRFNIISRPIQVREAVLPDPLRVFETELSLAGR